MRQALRVGLLLTCIAAAGAWLVPRAWERAFPTPEAFVEENPATVLDGAAVVRVNESLADALATLGISAEQIVASEEEPREAEGSSWVFTRTTVDLPVETSEAELRHVFGSMPDVDTFLTRPDELTWSLRVYAGKRPVHQLVLLQPLDPAPRVDPLSPPRLAVVLEGVGTRSENVQQLLELPYPLTLAILPYRSHTLRYATDAARAAKEVAAHLTFDVPQDDQAPAGLAPPLPLDATMDTATFRERLEEDMAAVPYISGVLLSSRSPTVADHDKMEVVAQLLGDRDLYLLDDLPVHHGVAIPAARRAGVAASTSTALLDGDAPLAEQERALLRTRNLAVSRGSAVLVVRGSDPDAARLETFLSERIEEGYRLSFASELIDTAGL